MLNYNKYVRFPTINLSDRTWADKQITHAPIWCSVDLRDGNQALINPMNIENKIEFFDMLVQIGFKEIEVGFPSASQIEFDFLRKLIDDKRIPDDVTVQVLTQARPELIKRTFESLKGVKRAIIHVYNSTSALQREVVFKKSKEEIKQIAIDGVNYIKKMAENFESEIILQYSPESFTGTEIEYALEICNAVCKVWGATLTRKVIINLPATVEMDMPNVYADQLEWFGRNLEDRNAVILSCHPHNDRGTAVAAGELSLLAGVDRLEGTLFGNGERTGNVDILNLAYNMLSHGINSELNIEDINHIIEVYERYCKISVPLRHPYAGELVFTAFSGSHQDAISKGLKYYKETKSPVWKVPYLPIDPSDIGRKYESFIRVNSQSGKGGVTFIMSDCFGYQLPRKFQIDFARIIQNASEQNGEMTPKDIMDIFTNEYINKQGPIELITVKMNEQQGKTNMNLVIKDRGIEKFIQGIGIGPLDALHDALACNNIIKFEISDYSQHTLGEDSKAQAVAYVQIKTEDKKYVCGAGTDNNIILASIKAIFSSINRIHNMS